MQEPVDILIVDDSPAKMLALETALMPLGERLRRASSGREALRHLLEHDVAVILLDVNMPGMSGFETAELIRGRERTAHTPIIFISAIDQTDAAATRGYRLGAVDYVYAPVVPEVIRAKVSVFVELHRKTAQARRQAEKIAADAQELAVSNERLRHSERLSALGTLAAGLGHDMGNLLLPVRIHLESIKTQEGVPAPVLDDVAAVLRCVEYLRRLAYGLRMLALDDEDQSASSGETGLGEWWTGFSRILRGCIPQGTVLEDRIEGAELRVRIPEHHLSQAVFNLVQNACDVLKDTEGGRVRVWSRPEGDASVLLAVGDNGPGMPEEIRRRCFEPFFTTKTRAISTGLGLSLVRTLVTGAGGKVRVESRPGAGTTFLLTLPGVHRRSATGAGAGEPARPRAFVSVEEQRMSGYISAVLGALGFDPATGAGAVPPGTGLWVVEGRRAQAGALAEFCGGDPRRRVVVIGDLPRRPRSGQVVVTGAGASPGAVRQALRTASDAARIPTKEPVDAAPD